MKHVNKVGDSSEHQERTWQDVEPHLTRLGREQELVDSAGYQSTIIAAATDATEDRLAWIETREKETSPGYWDVTHKLQACRDNEVIATIELPSYNPFFGCEVGLLEWHGDEIVTVYREKHETLVAVFDIEAGTRGRLLPIDDDWSSECGTVWFLSNEPGLIEACRLPDLVPGVPSPFGVDAPLRRFVQKPDHDPDSFAAKVALLLFGSDSPQPIADVLIGSAAFRFWDSWPTPQSRYGFRRRWNSPYWFPFYWQKANDTGGQELLHSVLEKLAAQSFADVDMEDYPARMAAEHICRAAEDWKSVCELDSLPERCRCHFWVEWSQKEFVRSLNLFPRGFREAYTDIAESRKTKNGGFFNRLFGR